MANKKQTDPYAEGTGIPKGQKGIRPPSIFEQKKRKKLGRSPGAMGGKINISKRKKPPGLDKTTWEDLKYVADQVSNTLMFAPNTVESIYKGDIKPLTDRYKKILETKKEYFTPKKSTNKKQMGGKIKKVKKAGGGMTGVGLYPAEMARAGTMSQARRKRYMKKGGKITYKMTGGQVVSHSYD
jgi:hypothetical protein